MPKDGCSTFFWAAQIGKTVAKFYPMLDFNTVNPGPTMLPLAVTTVEIFEPPTDTTVLAAPFFRIVDKSGTPTPLSGGQTQAYLIKERSNDTVTDDHVISLGVPVGDIVHARGASPGDDLCIFDYSQQPPQDRM